MWNAESGDLEHGIRRSGTLVGAQRRLGPPVTSIEVATGHPYPTWCVLGESKQDVLDVAYYSGWRKHEILFLTWEEIDGAGGVIRLSPARSKTRVGRILPLSPPIAEALARRRARRDPHSPLVFHRDGIPSIRTRCRR